MDSNELVSVIIPTKNSARTLDRCLASVKNQSYKNIELIIVDNNSTDRTKEIAKKYTTNVYNCGPERSAQRNFGAKKAKGKYLLIHDSDIYFHKFSVEECVKTISKGNFDALILPEKSIGEGYWTKIKNFERSFYVGNDLIEAPRFFKKEIFQKIGGYDLNLTACEDWDLTNRMREIGGAVGRVKIFLLHDEGKLTLFGSSSKKSYYAKWINIYKKKYPELSQKQFSPIYRFGGIPNIIRRGLLHPIKLISMVIMKYMETKAIK